MERQIHREKRLLMISFYQKDSRKTQSDLRKAPPKPGYQCGSSLRSDWSVKWFRGFPVYKIKSSLTG